MMQMNTMPVAKAEMLIRKPNIRLNLVADRFPDEFA
jgi:hypothetical protein